MRSPSDRFSSPSHGSKLRHCSTPSANSGPYKLLRFYGDVVTTQIDFVLPNIRTEIVRCGKYFFSNRTTVTPIRRDLCRLDFVAAWNLFPWLPIAPRPWISKLAPDGEAY